LLVANTPEKRIRPVETRNSRKEVLFASTGAGVK